MTAHVILSAIDSARPATLSPAVLTSLLRDEMGYDGLIVTDSLGMGALAQDFGAGVPSPGEIGLLAFQAGADVLAYGADTGATIDEQKTAYNRILSAVQNGEISEERLDASVRRILATKTEHGLFERQPVDPLQAEAQTGTDAHQAAAQAVADASITLVQDTVGMVPIAQEGQMMVVYPGFLSGFGEALASCRPDLILRPIPLDPTPTDMEQILLDADLAARVIVGTYNARRHPGQAQMVRSLPSEKLVVVGLSEPYDLLAFPDVPTYLATYGTVDASMLALAHILCGDVAPTGALPVALPGLYPLGQRHGNPGLLFLPITQAE